MGPEAGAEAGADLGADAAERPLLSPAVIAASALLSVGVIALISVVTRLDATDLGLFWRRLDVGVLALGLGTLGLRVLFGGLRFRHVGVGRLTLRQGIRGQLAWDFFSLVTPPVVGGGPFTAVFVARDARLPVGEGTAILLYAMLIEQVWTATSVLLLLAALPFLPVFPTALPAWGVSLLLAYFFGTLVWTAVLGWVMLYRPDRIERALRWASRRPWLRRFEGRLAHEAVSLRRRAEVLRGRGLAFFARGLGLTAAMWAARYALVVLVARAVVPDLRVGLFAVRSLAMSVGAMALPTPGGAGGIEGLYALFLGPLIHPPALIAPALLVWRTLAYYVFFAGGLVLTGRTVLRRKR